MLGMYYLFKNRITLVGVSISGAVTSNSIQIIMARLFVFGKAAWLIAPPFLGIGLVSGFLLGLFAEIFWKKSMWVKEITSALE